MKYKPLIRDAVKRNIDVLENEQPGTPRFTRATAIVEAYRHEEVIAMHDESVAVQREAIAVQRENTAVQKKVLYATWIILFFTVLLLVFASLQVKWSNDPPSRKVDNQSINAQSNTEPHKAKNEIINH